MIPTRTFAEIINIVCHRYDKTNLDPFLYNKIENALKTYYDGRYSLYVLAGAQDTAIVKYQHMKYYISYNNNTKKYEVDLFKL